VTVEEYIAQFGAALTEADKRYIRAFGVPAGYESVAPGRSPYTPGVRIADEPTADPALAIHSDVEALGETDEILARERQDTEDEEEADEWDEL